MKKSAFQDLPFQIDEFYLNLQADGQSIGLLTQQQIAEKPFPGLRPFRTSEYQLFKGRDGQSDDILKLLREKRFLAVIGSSGTGKSSLVRAGLIPLLYGGFLHKSRSRWDIAICRPGRDPIKNLSVALSSIMATNKEYLRMSEADGNENNESIDNRHIAKQIDSGSLLKEYEKIEPILRKSPYGISDVKNLIDTESKRNPGEHNLLVIIDQFEELFRFDRKTLKANPAYSNIENDFVQLLLKACSDKDRQIYVVTTMRSEFLGDCVKFRGLPEAINLSQYLVPQLDRIQLKEAIEQPIRMASKKIAPDLLEILINEIESEKIKENLDQLPILQHALMRTYEKAFANNPDNGVMEYSHYESIGGMKAALSKHADEVYRQLGKGKKTMNLPENEADMSKQQRIARLLFQALTDASIEHKSGRRPTELDTIYAIARCITDSEEEIDEVINIFREDQTAFIMPTETSLYNGLTLDIAHESLMRNWPELRSWIEKETRAANLYRKLNEWRELNDEEPGTYIKSGLLFNDLLKWRDSGFFNKAWGARYQKTTPDANSQSDKEALYQRNIDYLNSCEQKIKEEEMAIIARAENELKEKKIQQDIEFKNKKKTFQRNVLAGVAVLSLILLGYAYYQQKDAERQKSIAERQTIEAKRNLQLLDEKKIQLEKANKTADSANQELTQQKTELQVQKVLLESQTKELQQQTDDLEQQKADLQKQKEIAELQKDRIKNLLALNTIINEKFYKSLNSNQKEKTVEQLQPLKFANKDNEYDSIVNAIEIAVKAKKRSLINPNDGWAGSMRALEKNRNEVTLSINKSIVDSSLFYQQSFESKGLIEGDLKMRSVLFFDKKRQEFVVASSRLNASYQLKNKRLVENGKSHYKPRYDTIYGTGEVVERAFFYENYKDQFYDPNRDIFYGTIDSQLEALEVRKNDDGFFSLHQQITRHDIPNYSHAVLSDDGKSLVMTNWEKKLLVYSLERNAVVKSELLRQDSPKPDPNYDDLFQQRQDMILLKKNDYTGDLILLFADGLIQIRDKETAELKREFRLDWSNTRRASQPFRIDWVSIAANGKGAAYDSFGNRLAFFDTNTPGDALKPEELSINDLYKKMRISPMGNYVLLYGSDSAVLYDKSGLLKYIKRYDPTDYNKMLDYNLFLPSDNDYLFLRDIRFADEETLISADNIGIKLWMIKPGYTNPYTIEDSDNAPELNDELLLKNRLVPATEINDTTVLDEEADRAILNIMQEGRVSVDELNEINKVNERSAALKGYMDYRYLNRYVFLTAYRNMIDLAGKRKNYRLFHDRIKKAAEKFPNDENAYIEPELISFTNNELAWWKFFIGDFANAKEIVLKMYDLKSQNYNAYTDVTDKNMALAYFLAGDYEKAEDYYKRYKNIEFYDFKGFDDIYKKRYAGFLGNKVYFKDIFLTDLEMLENAKIINPSDPQIIKIKRLLRE